MTKKYVPLSFTSSGGEGGSSQTLNIDSSFTVVASDNVAGTNRVGYTISDSNDQNIPANIEVGTLFTEGAESIVTGGHLATAMYNRDSEGNIVSPYVQPNYDEETGEWISNEEDRVDADPDNALKSVQISTSQIQIHYIDTEARVEVHTRITPRGFEIDYADSERQVDTTHYYFPLPDGQEHTISVDSSSGGGSSGGSTLYEHQITIKTNSFENDTLITFNLSLPDSTPISSARGLESKLLTGKIIYPCMCHIQNYDSEQNVHRVVGLGRYICFEEGEDSLSAFLDYVSFPDCVLCEEHIRWSFISDYVKIFDESGNPTIDFYEADQGE